MKHTVLTSVLGTMMIAGNAYGATVFTNGTILGYNYLFPNTAAVFYDPGNITVGAGVELGGLYSAVDEGTLDVSGNNIFVDYYNTGGWTASDFNGFHIWDVNGTLPAFTSVAVNGVTNMVGFGPGNITFDADNIYVNWQGLSFDPDTIVSLDVNAVPEPTAALLSGIGALFLLRRRRH